MKGAAETHRYIQVCYSLRTESKGNRNEVEEEVEKMKNLGAVKGLRTYMTVFLKQGCSKSSRTGVPNPRGHSLWPVRN